MATSASGISFSGINTGLDTKSIISALMGVRAKPIALLENRRDGLENLKKTYQAFQSRVTALKNAADELKDAKDLLKYAVSSTDDKIVTASADGTATTTAFSVTVNALAKSEIESSQGFADFDTTHVGTGTIQLTVGGETKSITIATGQDTLEGIRDAINDSDLDVDASIVNVGTGTSPFKLVVTAKDTGDVNEITLDVSGLTGGSQALAFTETQDATDASITVNGITVQRSSNTIDDVVPGVDFTAKALGTATVTLAPDVAKMKETLSKYVAAHNDLVGFVNTQLKFNDATDKAGTLSGESGVRNLKNRVMNLLASTGYPGGELETLGAIGLSVQKDNSLTFDQAKFDTAVDDHLDEMVAMLTTTGDKISGTGLSLLKVPDNVASGSYAVAITQSASKADSTAGNVFGPSGLFQDENVTITMGTKSIVVGLKNGDDLATAISKLNDALDDAEIGITVSDDNGSLRFAANSYGSKSNFTVSSDVAASLTSSGIDTAGFSAFGTDVAGTIGGIAATGDGQVLTGTGAFKGVEVRSTAPGATAGTLTVGPDGFFVRLFEVLDDALENDGSVDARLDGIGKTITDIEKRIDSMTDRLQQYESQLESKFAALESIIGELNAKQAGFSAASQGFTINKG